MAVAVTDNAASSLTYSLLEQGFLENESDGYWYPAGISKSRARIKIENGIYTIQTRRGADEPWILLVRALVSDFDPSTFLKWTQDWPLQFQ